MTTAARFVDREASPAASSSTLAGVGYDVQVPLSTFYGLGEPGATVALRIHTHVREDLIALYGFSTPLEQDLFERLIAISGIGPKLALAVLSGIEPADLIRAIRSQDVARLTEDSGRRQEDRRADRPRAEGSAAGAGDASGRLGPAAAGRKISCATTCSRRWSISAISRLPRRRPSTAP